MRLRKVYWYAERKKTVDCTTMFLRADRAELTAQLPVQQKSPYFHKSTYSEDSAVSTLRQQAPH